MILELSPTEEGGKEVLHRTKSHSELGHFMAGLVKLPGDFECIQFQCKNHAAWH